MRSFLVHVYAWIAFWTTFVFAGNTTCLSDALDWYSNSVGETPCRTYERLRQLCVPDYQVGNFGNAPPGDTCSDQLRPCCCNSVAYALSMLCLSCQWDKGGAGDIGFDAVQGTYDKYLNNCGTPTNNNLSTTVQQAVCNQNIKIPAALYGLFWVPGDWYYVYTKQTATLDINGGRNDSGRCPSSTASSTPTSSNAQVTPISNSAGAGAWKAVGIAGIILAGLNLLAGIFLLHRYYRQRRPRLRSKESADLIERDQAFTDIDADVALSHRHVGHVYTPVSNPTTVPYDPPHTDLLPTSQPPQLSKREMIAANLRRGDLRGAFQASPQPSESRAETEARSSSIGVDGGYSLLLPPSYSR